MAIKSILIILIFLFTYSNALGQNAQQTGYWLSLGTGMGFVEGSTFHKNAFRQASRGALNLQFNNMIFRIRGSIAQGDAPSTSGYIAQPAELAHNNIFEYGLLAGYAVYKNRQSIVITAIGFATFHGSEPQFVGNPENRRITNGSIEGKGFAAEIGYYSKLGKGQNGIGIVMFSNLNATRSYGGITFNWFIGKIQT